MAASAASVSVWGSSRGNDDGDDGGDEPVVISKGDRISVYWPGDLKWEEGEVVEVIPPDMSIADAPRLQHRVRYDDGFEHVHDLCSAHRHSFDFKLVRAPPTRAAKAAKRARATASRLSKRLGLAKAVAKLDASSVLSFAFGLLALSPAFIMLYGMLFGRQ